MSPYASGTSVPVASSTAELEKILTKAGATKFFRGHDEGRAVVAFELQGRRIQFELPLPAPEPVKERRDWTVQDRARARAAAQKKQERATREKWRALVLAVKAKLVSAEAGVESLEEAFLAQVVVPGKDGRSTTVGKLSLPAVSEAYSTGKLSSPFLLGSGE